jgi:hypothetical protein
MISPKESRFVATHRDDPSPAPFPPAREEVTDEFAPLWAPATLGPYRAALREPEAAEAETSPFSLYFG